MADDTIMQVMGFDASDALKTLDLLDQKFGNLEKRMGSLAASMKQFNGVSSTVVASTKDIGKSFKTDLGQATKSVERLTVSWGLLSRIVTTQLIVSELRRLKTIFSDATKDAIQFQRSLAEIDTIAEGSLGSFDQLGDKVAGVAAAFNLDLGDAGKGLYEVISSQIADGAEAVEFFGSASAFAKGGITSLENSVSLLSGTMNAFEIDASEVDSVASKLFRTIDLGNVTAEQLTTSFNRVSGRSAQLGVSLEEQAAAFAVLTNRGIKHNEAATQISGILTSLIKPTDAMRDSLQQLGFAQAETAIQTLGLGGLLKALQENTDGSGEALAKLFPNVRGLSGALSLGAQANEQFNDALKQIQNTSASLNKAKSLEILATDAEKVTKEFNAFKISLATGIGQDLLDIGAGLVDVGITADNTGAILKAFGPVLATGTVLLAAYAAAALKGATANAAFVASFAGVSQGLLLGFGAAAAGSFLGNALVDAVARPQVEFERIQREALEKLKETEAEKLKALNAANDKRVKSALRSVAELNKAYLQDVENASKANKFLVEDAERTLDRIVSARQKYIDALRRASEETEQIAAESADRVSDLTQRADERQFERRTRRLDDPERALALTQRASEFASRAAAQLDEAGRRGDARATDRALDLFRRAEALADEAEQLGVRANNRQVEARAAQALNEITNKQIAAELRLQSIQDERRAALDKERERQEQIIKVLREQSQIVLENSSLFDEQGKALAPDQLASRAAARQAALAKIVETGFGAENLSIADALGLSKFAADLGPIDLQFRIEGGLNKLQSDLSQSFAKFKVGVNFDAGRLEGLLGRQLSSPDALSAGVVDAQKETAKLNKGFSDLRVESTNIQGLKTELTGIAAQAANGERALLRMLGINTDPSGVTRLLATMSSQLLEMGKSASISNEQIRAFNDNLESLHDKALQGNVAKNVGLGIDFEQFSHALRLLLQLQAAQKRLAENPAFAAGASQRLAALEGFLRTIDMAVAPSDSIATNFERAALAAERAAQAAAGMSGGGAGATEASGFAAGGFVPKGTDTIPAMLSPGEFVVNARSTRQFFSQLQAINSGQAPVYREDGGIVNNTTVGDIVIQGNADPRATARAVKAEINRIGRRNA